MKILIWLGCAFVYSLVSASLRYAGITIGAVPIIFLSGCTFAVATYLCKQYDLSQSDDEEDAENVAHSPSPRETVSLSLASAEVHTQKSEEVNQANSPYAIQNSKNRSFKITLVIALCLFFFCIFLIYRNHAVTADMEHTILSQEQIIQQLKSELNIATGELKNKESQIELIQKNAKERYVYFYNKGIYNGYMNGYNQAAKMNGQAKVVDEIWEQVELYDNISSLYRKYEE